MKTCPRCGKDLFDLDIQRCIFCHQLVEGEIEAIENEIKKEIYGSIHWYSFSPDKKSLVFLTGSYKNHNFYLFNCRLHKICWARSFCNDSRTLKLVNKVFFIEDTILVSIQASSAERGESSFRSFDLATGDFLREFKVEGKWTNIAISRSKIFVGCRNGYLYLLDKNLNLMKSICIKDPQVTYSSPYSIPSPFHVVINCTGELLAFGSEANLYLFDDELNYIWSINIISDIQFRIQHNESFKLKDEKHKAAYNVLGAHPGCDQQQLKKAYLKKALDWHPDRHVLKDKEEAERRFKEIANAYELLRGVNDDSFDVVLESAGFRGDFFIRVFDRITEIKFIKDGTPGIEYLYITTANGLKKTFSLLGNAIGETSLKEIR